MSSKDINKCRIDECPPKGLAFHQFFNSKSNLEGFKKWIEILKTGIQSMNPLNVYQKKCVCSDHFSLNDINPGIKLKIDDNSPQSKLEVELVQCKSTVSSSSALIYNYSSCKNVAVVLDKYDELNLSAIQILNDSDFQNNDRVTDSRCINNEVCGLIRPISPTVSRQCIWFSKLYL